MFVIVCQFYMFTPFFFIAAGGGVSCEGKRGRRLILHCSPSFLSITACGKACNIAGVIARSTCFFGMSPNFTI